MDKFRVGQIVRIVKPAVLHIGDIVTIVKQRTNTRAIDSRGKIGVMFCYELSNGKVAYENSLEPVYDGDVASSWSESVWKPKELIKE